MRKNNEQNNVSSRINDVKIIHICEYACQCLEWGLEGSIHFTTLNRVPLKFPPTWNLRMMKLAMWRRGHATLGWPLNPWMVSLTNTHREDSAWRWRWRPEELRSTQGMRAGLARPGARRKAGQTLLRSLLEKPTLWHLDFRLQPPDCKKKTQLLWLSAKCFMIACDGRDKDIHIPA